MMHLQEFIIFFGREVSGSAEGYAEIPPPCIFVLAIYPVGVYYGKGKQTTAIISEENT